MKRCPTCNRTFDEDWLAFCTDDGTTLIDEASSRSEPPPTMMAPPMPPSVSPSEQPTINLSPSGGFQPQQPYSPPAPYGPPREMQPVWRPPPPPPIAPQPQQGLAVASLVCGIFSVTIGWCYVGLVSGPVAIALGIAALVQVKNKPEQYGGKPLAIAGIVTGALPFVVLLLIIVLAVIMQAAK